MKEILKDKFVKSLFVYYFVLLFFAFLITVVNKYKVLYYLPLNFINILVVLSLFLLAIGYIKIVGIYDSKIFLWHQYVLKLFPLLIFVYGIYYPIHNHMSAYISKPNVVATVLNTNITNNYIRSIVITQNDIDKIKTNPISFYPKDQTVIQKDRVYVFHRVGCDMCQLVMPKMLSELTHAQKEKIIFIDFDMEHSREYAQYLGIKKASSIAYSTKNKKGFYVINRSRLVVEKDKGKAIPNYAALNVIHDLTK